MIIGFGKTETDYENSIQEEFVDQVKQDFRHCLEDWFDDDFTSAIRQWAEGKAAQSRATAESHRTAEAFPDRYSSYYVTVIRDPSHIVFIIRFTHINRRHAMSPDGWASLSTERIFYVYLQDAMRLR